MLKKLIEELVSPSSVNTTTSQSEILDSGNLTDLYNVIITAEEQISTNQEII